MSLKYPDIHKKREHRLTEHSRALITKIIRTEPSRNEGNDGDIIFGNTREGLKLYVRMNNKWHAFSPDEEPLNIYSSSSYTTNRTITGATSAADTANVLATLINDLINIGILKKPNKK